MRIELDGLINEGIIQEEEATDWLSPVVMAHKANGEACGAVAMQHCKDTKQSTDKGDIERGMHKDIAQIVL
ncbi:hypothetical protein NDU88_005453 [Pleurodeles waltl]|uniref:Uncharacterized protein n=1 Tax=Pleurodeles waltl TaxID=8319 RepID=A0AAV7MZC4_PLEWA|nr:hypothetical protein NDU88_005453 [Pleurodeles waltl]